MAETEFQWTQDSWEPEAEVTERHAASRNERLAWFGAIALVVVAFEVTADPALTVSLGCLKFGWDEFRLARWLGRSDPDRQRGITCSLFYLSWGFWRISLVATTMAFLIAFAQVAILDLFVNLRGAGGAPSGFVGAFLLALTGFILSSVLSSLAVVLALRYRIKVWVGPEARWAREENVWPPNAVVRRRITENRAKPIVLSALITGLMVGLFATLIPLSCAFPNGFRSPTSIAIMVIIELIFLLVVPFLILVLLGMLGDRMIAPSPEACWAEPSPLESSKGY